MAKVRKRIAIAIAVFLTSAITFSACLGDPYAPIKVQNETSQTLYISVFGVFIGRAAPGETVENKEIMLGIDHYRITARDENGQIAFEKDFASAELKKQKYIVVITEVRR